MNHKEVIPWEDISSRPDNNYLPVSNNEHEACSFPLSDITNEQTQQKTSSVGHGFTEGDAIVRSNDEQVRHAFNNNFKRKNVATENRSKLKAGRITLSGGKLTQHKNLEKNNEKGETELTASTSGTALINDDVGQIKEKENSLDRNNDRCCNLVNDEINVTNTETWDIGDPIWECQYCKAQMWYNERIEKRWNTKNPKFSLCCMQGKIKVDNLQPPPQPLSDLFHKKDMKSKLFLENIRSFNMMFSFTSMGGKIDVSKNDGNAPPMFIMNGENYHQIGSLLPLQGNQPKFAQLYIYDTDNEISNRMSVVGMTKDGSPLQESIITDIKNMLDEINPYVKAYRMVRERIQVSNIKDIKVRIKGKRGREGRTYNLPSVSEVAALIVDGSDSGDAERDLIVETRSGILKRVSVVSQAYLPLQYPLLFPKGEAGYTDNIPLNDHSRTTSNKRQKVSMREFISYRIQHRMVEQSSLLVSKRLFQQFLVDCYSMIESSRLHYVRTHQKELRAEMYKGLKEAILRGENNPSATGKRIVLPSSFTGGARYMFQNYQDAMAICSWVGYPDLFITFTCNKKWPELCRALEKEGLKSEDRPDLICRVFKIKLDQLIAEIKQGNVFGKINAVIYTIEFQKRGLPHAHILVFLQPQYRNPNPADIDKIICAEIPDQRIDPHLYKIVAAVMIHGPCGIQNRRSPCMQNGKCSKYFPKKYVDKTTIDADGYPLYRRRDDGKVIRKGDSIIDNRFVVPYNRYLLLRYNAHINVEWCNQSRSIKYLFKYVNKGHDRITATFYDSATRPNESECVDEIKMYYDCRYLSSCEAAWRIFSFDIHYREPSVERLSFHLPGEHFVVFDEDVPIEQILDKPKTNTSMFLAWMDANKTYHEAKNLLYAQFPSKFVWKQREHQWCPRQRGTTVGRLQFIPPGSGELYYLRILLNYSRGPQSYDEIRTINNVIYPTFKDACYALGLLDDDREYVDAIIEASHWGSGSYLRRLYVTLLLSNQLSRPEVIWQKTWKYLSDDILYRQRVLLQSNDLMLTDEELKNITLSELQKLLQSNNRSLSDFPSMPHPNINMIFECQNQLIYDELNYDRESLITEHEHLLSTMTAEQRKIYDTIMLSVSANCGGLFFLYGYGGTGKTFLWRAISAAIRSKGEIVLTVASSGIAALLIPGGRTAHSRFQIPINVNEDSTCNINQGSPLAELIMKSKLIIWDEAPMTHRHCFEAVDRTFKDILRFSNKNNLNLPFGGKVVVFGGDFRQILPVIPKGTRQDIVHASINASYLWSLCKVLTLTKNMRLECGSSDEEVCQLKEFSEWVLGIGNGSIGKLHDEDATIEIPYDMLIENSSNPLNAIVNSTYPSLLQNMRVLSFFQDRAILAPTNDVVNELNEYIMSLLPGETKTYLSLDSPYSAHGNIDRPDDVHTPEFLNTIYASGLPNHKLKLKIGVPIMLMRNIDQSSGLCNGTRLIVTQMGNHVLEAKVISGSKIGEKVFIPRLSLIPSDPRIPFKFQRKQFPVIVSFAMTINKSQGQSLRHVGIYLPKSVFSHGQLYVALSRVTTRTGLKILICNNEGQVTNTTSNVVYKEVFQNLS